MDLPREMMELLARCELGRGTPRERVLQLETGCGRLFPLDYVDFLVAYGGCEGWIGPNYIQLWPVEQIVRYGRYEHVPDLLFIGSDGGGEGIALDLHGSPTTIINVPFMAMDDAHKKVLGRSLEEVLRRLFVARLTDM